MAVMVCSRPIRGTDSPATGTDAGWQRHYRAKEPACRPCLEAHRAHVGDVQKSHPTYHRAANRKWREQNPDYFEKWRAAHPEYDCWKNMIRRCADPKATSYPRYGAVGVKVCQRWIRSFDDFLADVGPRPSRKHTLDRINTYGNYEPGNVRWATRVQQRANRRVK